VELLAETKKRLDAMTEPKVPDKENDEESLSHELTYLKLVKAVKEFLGEDVSNFNCPFDEEDEEFSDEDIKHDFASVKNEWEPCKNTSYNTSKRYKTPARPINPLFNAAYEGKFELLKILLENKEELDSIGIKLNTSRYEDATEEISDGRGPLLLEAANGLVELLKTNEIELSAFLEFISFKGETEDNGTDNHCIVGSGACERLDCINIIIEYCYKNNVNDDLYYALEHEYYDSFKIMVHLLKKHGGFLARPVDGRNPLFSTTNTEFLRDLVILGYNVNSVNANGDTVFMLNKDVCNCFLAYSQMNYYIKNKQGHTLLYKAIEWEDKSLVNIMIKKRLSTNDVDINGQSPLDRAIFSGNYEIVKLLLDNGAYLYNKGSIAINEGRNRTLKEHNHNCYKIMKALNKLEEELNE